MLHPSTKHLIDRIGEMTEAGKIKWTEGTNGTLRFETKGYGVEVEAVPARIAILTPDGKTIEDASTELLSATPHDRMGTYAAFVTSLTEKATAEIAAMQQRDEADSAIKTILTGLDLDGDGVPDVYVPADEASAVAAADAVSQAAVGDESVEEDAGEETRYAEAPGLDDASPETLSAPVETEVPDMSETAGAQGEFGGAAAFAAGGAVLGAAGASLLGGGGAAESEETPEQEFAADDAPTDTPDAMAVPEPLVEPTPEIDQPVEAAAPVETSPQPDTFGARPGNIAFGAGLSGTMVPEQPETQEAAPVQDDPPAPVDDPFGVASSSVDDTADEGVGAAPEETASAEDAVEAGSVETSGFSFGAPAESAADPIQPTPDAATPSDSFAFGATGQNVTDAPADNPEPSFEPAPEANETTSAAPMGFGFGAATANLAEQAVSHVGEAPESAGEAASDITEHATETAQDSFGDAVDRAGDAVDDAASGLATTTGFGAVASEAPSTTENATEESSPAPEAAPDASMSAVFGGLGSAANTVAETASESVQETASAFGVTPAEPTSQDATSESQSEDTLGDSDDEDAKPDNKPGGKFNPWM